MLTVKNQNSGWPVNGPRSVEQALHVASAFPVQSEPRVQHVQTVASKSAEPPLEAKAETGGERSAFLRPAGWSRKLFGVLNMSWALGGGFRALSILAAAIAAPVAAAVDLLSLPVSVPYTLWGPQEQPNPRAELMALITDKVLHPPEGFDNLSQATVVDPAVAGFGGDMPTLMAALKAEEKAPEIMADLLQKNMSIDVPSFIFKILFSRPELIQRLLAWNPALIREAFLLIKDAEEGPKDRGHQLGKSVDLNTFNLSSIEIRKSQPVQIGPNLFYGETPGVAPGG